MRAAFKIIAGWTGEAQRCPTRRSMFRKPGEFTADNQPLQSAGAMLILRILTQREAEVLAPEADGKSAKDERDIASRIVERHIKRAGMRSRTKFWSSLIAFVLGEGLTRACYCRVRCALVRARGNDDKTTMSARSSGERKLSRLLYMIAVMMSTLCARPAMAVIDLAGATVMTPTGLMTSSAETTDRLMLIEEFERSGNDAVLAPTAAYAPFDPVWNSDEGSALQLDASGAGSLLPEPETWPLMLIGFAVVGVHARRAAVVRSTNC